MVNTNFDFLNNMRYIALIEEPDATIKYANDAFCSFYDISSEEAVGKNLLDFLLPEDRPGCNAQFMVTPDNPQYSVEGRTVGADGTVTWLQFVGRGFFDNKGTLIEFQEIAIDITVWKEKIASEVKKLNKLNAQSFAAFNGNTTTQTGEFDTNEKDEKIRNQNPYNARTLGNIATYTFDDIIARSHQMKTLIKQAKQASRGDSSILIEGESGTGKELFAQAIHNYSKRANGPFVAINCGSISPELLQSELFGYVEGAFTGAGKKGKSGKFELASGGTLFLDEIGEMPVDQQITLLRVLESKTVTRIGGHRVIPVNVRIICATNKKLFREVYEGNFRKDLYFRLNVINFTIPPLRERKEDIYPLVEHIIESFGSHISDDIKYFFTDEQMRMMYESQWLGNVRELRNIIERLIYIPGYDLRQLMENEKETIKITEEAIDSDEKSIIENKIRECRYNMTAAAKELGISRKTLYNKIKRHNIHIKR
ncbi:MAG: sigma 54-interacting transcriptional regulator [Eubacteriaceae bacterium]|nr:sigma 54-interacting transcriptional regulator [Eubacteriaceae bacterium]